MSEKIYEYKDDQDWYITKWSETESFSNFSQVSAEACKILEDLQVALNKDGHNFPIEVTILRYHSAYRLLVFLVDLINEEAKRKLELIQRQGALLVVESGQLLYVYIPQGGVSLTDFLGAKEVKDTLLIATRNEGKTKEFRKLFGKLGYKVENLNDYPDLPEVAETGMTFEENARLKAETISQLTGKMVLADDSGLQVDILGGLPGVWSARFAGVGATDTENNIKLLHELAMVFELKDRAAHFHTTLVVARPEKESLVVEADWPGYINFEPKGENGFGYDPLFLVGETGKTSAELTVEEKNEQSHRAQAVKKLMEVFPAWQSKQSL